MTIAIIALGSNLDNPAEQVRQAAQRIAALPEMVSFRLSSLYVTAPVGYAEQPDFINAVAQIDTNYSAFELLRELQNIEQQFGRVRTFQNAPRTLDLDIIDFNHENVNAPDLILPHPRAHLRGFVMLPLAEIAPDYVIGEYGSAADIAANLGDEGVRIFQKN